MPLNKTQSITFESALLLVSSSDYGYSVSVEHNQPRITSSFELPLYLIFFYLSNCKDPNTVITDLKHNTNMRGNIPFSVLGMRHI